MGLDFLFVGAIILALNLCAYFIAFYKQTDALTDFTYSLSFISVIIYGFLKFDMSIVQFVLWSMILFWAARLGVFLYSRIRFLGKDERFDSFRKGRLSFLMFWLLQAVSVMIIAIPVVINFTTAPSKLSTLSFIGIGVWAFGFLLEWRSDRFKFRYKLKNPNEPAMKGPFSWVRYPNYLGEILCWLGVAIFVFNPLYPITLLAFISPIWVATLLVKISGIPLLEKNYKIKYKDHPVFQEYTKSTSRLIPGVW